MQAKKRIPTGALIFSLVLLANPNFNVVDIFPDFIAWWILARLFSAPADIAPYFEEARSTFMKLFWVTLIKTLTVGIALDGGFNDQTALFAFVFAIAELILSLMAVHYTFEALFYLGSRTDASALIRPFGKKRRITPESLRAYLYFFFVIKALCSSLPEFFLLTGEDNTAKTLLGRGFYYPRFLMLAMAITLVLAIPFVARTRRYIKEICKEGALQAALFGFIPDTERPEYERRVKGKRIVKSLTTLTAAFVFCLDFSADTFHGINILPQFIFGILFFVGIFTVRKDFKGSVLLLILSAIFIGESIFTYATSIRFFDSYTMELLLFHDEAIAAYSLYELATLIEGCLFALLLVIFTLLSRRFIKENTGEVSVRAMHGVIDDGYHRSLFLRGTVLLSLSLLHAAARVVSVFLSGAPKFMNAGEYESTLQNVILAPRIEWFNTVVTLLGVLAVLFAFYFFATVKDAVKEKYGDL